MKQRTEVNRKIAIIALIVMFICMTVIAFQTEAQVKPKKIESGKEYHLRLQKLNSWEAYQGNYKKAMLSNAKESRKQRREQEESKKIRQRFLAKLERIKGSE